MGKSCGRRGRERERRDGQEGREGWESVHGAGLDERCGVFKGIDAAAHWKRGGL